MEVSREFERPNAFYRAFGDALIMNSLDDIEMAK